MKACILRATRSVRDGRCTEQRIASYERHMNAMAGNTLNLMCGEFDGDSDRCSRLPPIPSVGEPAQSIFAGFGEHKKSS